MEQDNRRVPQRNTGRKIPSGGGMATLIASAVLGVSLIISAAIIGGAVKKLTQAVEKQVFTSSYSAPSSITVRSPSEKKYMNLSEASEYLGISEKEIKNAISEQKIKEYVKTGDGYSIAVDKLDSYFAERAYDQYMADNSGDE